MKRGRSTGNPTKAQQERMDAIKDRGCVVAFNLGMGDVYCEIHHLTVGGKHGQKRRGHDFTVGLNPWSHRGVPFNGWTVRQCKEMFGPSYALEPRRFREEIGSDEELLARQNAYLEGGGRMAMKWIDPARMSRTGRKGGRANIGRYCIEGETVTMDDIATRLGVSSTTATKRLEVARGKPGAITWAGLSRNNSSAALPHNEEVR